MAMEELVDLMRGPHDTQIALLQDRIRQLTEVPLLSVSSLPPSHKHQDEKFFLLLYSCVNGYDEFLIILLDLNVNVNQSSKVTVLISSYLSEAKVEHLVFGLSAVTPSKWSEHSRSTIPS
jgi:hypothetical protein